VVGSATWCAWEKWYSHSFYNAVLLFQNYVYMMPVRVMFVYGKTAQVIYFNGGMGAFKALRRNFNTITHDFLVILMVFNPFFVFFFLFFFWRNVLILLYFFHFGSLCHNYVPLPSARIFLVIYFSIFFFFLLIVSWS